MHGIDNRTKGQIRVGVCALLWAIWHVRNDFIFNTSCFFPAGYPASCSLDKYEVMPTAGGAPTGHGFWVQPLGDGRLGIIQPVRLAA